VGRGEQDVRVGWGEQDVRVGWGRLPQGILFRVCPVPTTGLFPPPPSVRSTPRRVASHRPLHPFPGISSALCGLCQGVGVVGLWTLVHLKDLDLSGNPDLVLGDVLASLGGKPWRSQVKELPNDRAVAPVEALENVRLGLPTAAKAPGKVWVHTAPPPSPRFPSCPPSRSLPPTQRPAHACVSLAATRGTTRPGCRRATPPTHPYSLRQCDIPTSSTPPPTLAHAPMQTWWQDRTLSPFITAAGANIEAAVMALAPVNKHLRVVEGMVLCPPALAAAYQTHMRWQAVQANVRLSFLAHLSVVLSCVPPHWRLGEADDLRVRSHHPDDVMNESQYRPMEVGPGACVGGAGWRVPV
jgi:hypothetical protein